MQKKVMLLAVFLLSFLAAVTPAQSQGVDSQCIDQLENVCGEVQPGSGRIQQCFDNNRDKFTPVCQQQLMEGKAETAAAIVTSRRQKELAKSDPAAYTRQVGEALDHVRKAEVAGNAGSIPEMMRHTKLSLEQAQAAQGAGTNPTLDEAITDLKETLRAGQRDQISHSALREARIKLSKAATSPDRGIDTKSP